MDGRSDSYCREPYRRSTLFFFTSWLSIKNAHTISSSKRLTINQWQLSRKIECYDGNLGICWIIETLSWAVDEEWIDWLHFNNEPKICGSSWCKWETRRTICTMLSSSDNFYFARHAQFGAQDHRPLLGLRQFSCVTESFPIRSDSNTTHRTLTTQTMRCSRRGCPPLY